jgi:hypothetical protein
MNPSAGIKRTNRGHRKSYCLDCRCRGGVFGWMADGPVMLLIVDLQTDLCPTMGEHHLGWTIPSGLQGVDARAVAGIALTL